MGQDSYRRAPGACARGARAAFPPSALPMARSPRHLLPGSSARPRPSSPGPGETSPRAPDLSTRAPPRRTGAATRALRRACFPPAGTPHNAHSPLNFEKRKGTFVCAGCGNPLYESSTKYDSGTGWCAPPPPRPPPLFPPGTSPARTAHLPRPVLFSRPGPRRAPVSRIGAGRPSTRRSTALLRRSRTSQSCSFPGRRCAWLCRSGASVPATPPPLRRARRQNALRVPCCAAPRGRPAAACPSAGRPPPAPSPEPDLCALTLSVCSAARPPNPDPLREVRGPPRARLRRRPGAHGDALLHERPRAAVRAVGVRRG